MVYTRWSILGCEKSGTLPAVALLAPAKTYLRLIRAKLKTLL